MGSSGSVHDASAFAGPSRGSRSAGLLVVVAWALACTCACGAREARAGRATAAAPATSPTPPDAADLLARANQWCAAHAADCDVVERRLAYDDAAPSVETKALIADVRERLWSRGYGLCWQTQERRFVVVGDLRAHAPGVSVAVIEQDVRALLGGNFERGGLVLPPDDPTIARLRAHPDAYIDVLLARLLCPLPAAETLPTRFWTSFVERVVQAGASPRRTSEALDRLDAALAAALAQAVDDEPREALFRLRARVVLLRESVLRSGERSPARD